MFFYLNQITRSYMKVISKYFVTQTFIAIECIKVSQHAQIILIFVRYLCCFSNTNIVNIFPVKDY